MPKIIFKVEKTLVFGELGCLYFNFVQHKFVDDIPVARRWSLQGVLYLDGFFGVVTFFTLKTKNQI